MANVTLTPQKCKRDDITAFTLTSISANDTFEIDWNVRDESAALIILASSTAPTVTIDAGAGVQGNKKFEKACEASKYNVIPINSGRFKNDYGTNVGKVTGKVTTAAVTAAVVEFID